MMVMVVILLDGSTNGAIASCMNATDGMVCSSVSDDLYCVYKNGIYANDDVDGDNVDSTLSIS